MLLLFGICDQESTVAVPKKKLSKINTLLTQAHALHQQHQYEQAAKLYEKLLKLAPRHLDALNLLGLLRYQQGRLEEAGKLLERAIQVNPDHKQAWLNYGNLRQQLRDLQGAVEAFQQVLRIDPNSSFALLNLGNCMRVLGRHDEADAFYLRSLAADPTYSLAWANLGKLARAKGQWERAMKTADAALDCPDPAPLGLCLWIEVHHLTKPSAELAQRAQELLSHSGSTGELLAEGQFFAHHIYGLDPQVLLRARDRVQRQIAATVEPGVSDKCPPPRAEPRTLGFISSAFRRHPVAFMALGALENLRQQGFRICIYDGRPQDDAYAQRFRACADVWHDISPMPDAEVVELIRADGVDVLFDMSGVTNHGRPRIPAMRAAPLQVKWVGGQSGPSGIPNMDAFLTDVVQSPSWADADHHERLLRMPHGYVTYTPPIDVPEPAAEPPVKRNGYITFGSLNKLAKLSIELLQVWAQILRAVPDSRLLIRTEGANEQVIQNAVAEVMEANGISRERLSFEGPAGHREFLETYNRIDIALDSFPYTGGLTTCEAMWMGVPVVALAGRFFCERHAATHLHNVGLGEWVASDTDEYIAKAIALAQDHERLAHYRIGLREQVARSPLCDYEQFTADLAGLIRAEWACRFGDIAEDVSVDMQPDAPSIERARDLLAKGNATAAINECRLLMEAGNTSAEVLELAGLAANASGHTADAVDLLRMTLDKEPERASTLEALLDIVEHLGEAEVADQLRGELARIAETE